MDPVALEIALAMAAGQATPRGGAAEERAAAAPGSVAAAPPAASGLSFGAAAAPGSVVAAAAASPAAGGLSFGAAAAPGSVAAAASPAAGGLSFGAAPAPGPVSAAGPAGMKVLSAHRPPLISDTSVLRPPPHRCHPYLLWRLETLSSTYLFVQGGNDKRRSHANRFIFRLWHSCARICHSAVVLYDFNNQNPAREDTERFDILARQ